MVTNIQIYEPKGSFYSNHCTEIYRKSLVFVVFLVDYVPTIGAGAKAIGHKGLGLFSKGL